MPLPLQNKQTARNPVVFLDRDGVINRDSPDYIKGWHEFEFLPGSPEAIARFTAAGFAVIVITNQSALGRGMITPAVLDDLHTRLIRSVRQRGGEITDIFFCPHTPDDECPCRKPKPGLIRQACGKYGIDPATAWMIGDSAKDIECGRNAGCGHTALVRTGNGRKAEAGLKARKILPDLVVRDLSEAAERICSLGIIGKSSVKSVDKKKNMF